MYTKQKWSIKGDLIAYEWFIPGTCIGKRHIDKGVGEGHLKIYYTLFTHKNGYTYGYHIWYIIGQYNECLETYKNIKRTLGWR